MRKRYFTCLLILVIIFCTLCCRKSNDNTENNIIDEDIEQSESIALFSIYDFKFFGFTLKDTQEVVVETLKAQNKSIKIFDFGNTVKIAPEDQNIVAGLNMDYEIEFFKGQILKIRKFENDNSYKNILLKNLGEDFLKINESEDEYVWTYDDVEIEFYNDPYEPMLTVINKTVEAEYIKQADYIAPAD